MTDSFPDQTRALTITRTDAWAIWELLCAHLAGFAGRSETAAPWHAEHIVAKLAYALPRFEPPHPVETVELDCTQGELVCLAYNIPRTSYQGAPALLLQVMRAMGEFTYDMPLLETEPEDSDILVRFRQWQTQTTNADPTPDGGA